MRKALPYPTWKIKVGILSSEHGVGRSLVGERGIGFLAGCRRGCGSIGGEALLLRRAESLRHLQTRILHHFFSYRGNLFCS